MIQYAKISIISILLISTIAFSTITFTKTFGGSGYEDGNSVQQTSDGGYIIAGSTTSFTGGHDFWIVKTDENGNEEWNNYFGDTYRDAASSIQETTDGGYILSGTTESVETGRDMWLVKTDIGGDVSWIKNYGGGSGDYGKVVGQTSDGGYFITGYSSSYGQGVMIFYFKKQMQMGIHYGQKLMDIVEEKRFFLLSRL